MTTVRVCLESGCGEWVTPPHRRCPEHRRAQPRSPTSAVVNTSRWRRLRRRVLERDRYRCRTCGAPATQVDHVVPVALGGDAYDERNLAASCVRCNASAGGRLAHELRRLG